MASVKIHKKQTKMSALAKRFDCSGRRKIKDINSNHLQWRFLVLPPLSPRRQLFSWHPRVSIAPQILPRCLVRPSFLIFCCPCWWKEECCCCYGVFDVKREKEKKVALQIIIFLAENTGRTAIILFKYPKMIIFLACGFSSF